jgi:hypothetical protein
MTSSFNHRRRKSKQSGYALLTVIFLGTLMLLTLILAAPRITLEGQRQKELDMVWRGKQYARGVKLYYRKLGRFPTSVDDLTKPKIGSIRFMRQAYKDPMNREDGSWRLLYVGPGGQLIGSTKPPRRNLLGSLQPGGGALTPPANATGGSGGPGGNPTPGLGGTATGAGSTQNVNTGQGATGSTETAPGGASDSSPTNPGTETSFSNSNPLIGGNIIGVGSKVKHPSLIVYDHAKNYWQFEFIWDPSKDAMGAGQPGVNIGTPIGGQAPGTNPMNPPPNPPLTPQQPQN